METVHSVGPNGNQSYAYHLHLEMGRGNGTEKIANNQSIGIDPATQWKSTNADSAWKLED